MINKIKIKEDIAELFNSLECIHPNLYYNSDRKETIRKIEELTQSINGDMSELELYKKVAPIISDLNDGHTGCFPGNTYDEYIREGKLLIPIDVSYRDGKLLINEVLIKTENNQRGSEILSINGIKTKEIVSKMKEYISGEDDTFKEALIGNYFRVFLWMLFDMTIDFDLEVLKNNSIDFLRLNGEEHSIISDSIKGLDVERRKSSLKVIGDTAVLTFESFENYDKDKERIDYYFDHVIEKNCERLIIDVRNNGGGDSRVGDAILGRLLHKPFRQYSSVKIKVSENIKEYYGNDEFIRGYYEKYDPSILQRVQNAVVGELISVQGEYIKGEGKDVYKGEVILLTSPLTYSSASSFVTAFNDYGIGKIVGESPGGFSNSYGDVYMFKLSNSGLEVFVSHKFHIRPNGDERLSKINPHIEVHRIHEMDIIEIVNMF